MLRKIAAIAGLTIMVFGLLEMSYREEGAIAAAAEVRLFEFTMGEYGVLYEGLSLYRAKLQSKGEGKVTRYGYVNCQGKVFI